MNGILAFATTWVDLEIVTLSEVKSEGERQIHVISFKCLTQKKIKQMNVCVKPETDSWIQKIN